MTKLEKELEAQLVKAINRRGGWCPKWTSPGAAGVPDRIVLLPGGRILFVEMKRPKGSRVGALQEYWRDVLTRLGFEHRIIYTESELHNLLAELDLEEVRR